MKKIGYVKVEIPAFLTGITGLTVSTSCGKGLVNTLLPAMVGKEYISVSGKLVSNNDQFAVDLKIAVTVTENKIVTLSVPYLDLLKNLGF